MQKVVDKRYTSHLWFGHHPKLRKTAYEDGTAGAVSAGVNDGACHRKGSQFGDPNGTALGGLPGTAKCQSAQGFDADVPLSPGYGSGTLERRARESPLRGPRHA